eukprot:s2462_g9.t1
MAAACLLCRSTGGEVQPDPVAQLRAVERRDEDDCSDEFRRLMEKLVSRHLHELAELKQELLFCQQRRGRQPEDDEVLPEAAAKDQLSPRVPVPDVSPKPSPRLSPRPSQRPHIGKNISVSSCLAPLSGEEVEVQASSRESRAEPDEKALNQAAEELQLELGSMMEGTHYEPPEADHSRLGRLRRIFASPEYELAVTLLIFVNALVIGLQFQYEGFQLAHLISFPGYSASADELWPGISTVFDVLQVTFTSLFLADVVIRGCLFWKTFFCDWFNWLDLVVVLSSVFDLITSGMFNTSVLRLLRLTKLTRSIRILKVSSVLDSLNMIMKCLRASVGTLFWSLCVLLVIQCIGAIVIMYTVQTYIRSPNDLTQENRLLVFAYFGTFSRSMLTMFEVLFANWITPCRILVEHLSEYFSAVFILYRCLVGFAVLNVIQAVFIQRTMQVAQDDKELQLKQKQYAAKTFERKLRYIFEEFFSFKWLSWFIVLRQSFCGEELDTSGDGIVTWEEFDDQLKDPRTGALLSMIEIDAQDLRVFYDLLDDGDGRVDAQKFAQGVLAMKGPAKGIDLAQLSKNVGRLGLMVQQLSESLGTGRISERLQGADVVRRLPEAAGSRLGFLRNLWNWLAHEASLALKAICKSL